MNRIYTWLILAVFMVSLSSYASSSCFDGKGCGWHFYDDPPKPVLTTTPDMKPAAPSRNPKLVEAEAWKKQVNDSLLVATYEPSPQNVMNYIKLKDQLVRNADEMSDVHQKLMWANPDKDFSVTGRPISQVGMNTFDAERKARLKATIERLAKTHVLFYFARSDCPYCQQFSPALRAFSDASGIRVFAISVDGQELASFPNAQPDNGIGETLKVTMVPALFMVEPSTGNITPVGFGVLGEQELLSRLDAIANPDAEPVGVTTLQPAVKPPSRSTPLVPSTRVSVSTTRSLIGGRP
jgi:conjugal transfer pilus assembly protein TraF